VWLEKAATSRLAFQIGERTPIKFSFHKVKQQDRSYTMHPVVQDWGLQVASTDCNANSQQLNELALVCIGYNIPSSVSENIPSFSNDLFHTIIIYVIEMVRR
jgi:hypothetical protein